MSCHSSMSLQLEVRNLCKHQNCHWFDYSLAYAGLFRVSLRKGTLLGRLSFLIVAGIITGNYLLTLVSLRASIVNYPGGQALAAFHRIQLTTCTLFFGLFADSSHTSIVAAPHVHISNLAAQTGASLFLQLNAPPYHIIQGPRESWSYNKTENLTFQQLTASSTFTHLISEVKPNTRVLTEWKVMDIVQGFERWAIDWELLKGRFGGDLLRRVWDVVRMVQGDKLWILERLWEPMYLFHGFYSIIIELCAFLSLSKTSLSSWKLEFGANSRNILISEKLHIH